MICYDCKKQIKGRGKKVLRPIPGPGDDCSIGTFICEECKSKETIKKHTNSLDVQKEYCVHQEDEKYHGIWKSDCGLNGSYPGGIYCYNCGKKIKKIESKFTLELQKEREKEKEEEKKLRKEGYDVWAEYGGRKIAKHVDSEKFGPHKYIDCDGTSDCEYKCGCWMGPSRSGGPVDPWGACPKNPKEKN